MNFVPRKPELSQMDRVALLDAINHLEQNDILRAWSSVQGLFRTFGEELEVLEVYLRVAAEQNPADSLNVINALKTNVAVAFAVAVDIYIYGRNMEAAEAKLKSAKALFTSEKDMNLIKCAEVRYLCMMSTVTGHRTFLDEAASLANSLNTPTSAYDADEVGFVKCLVSVLRGENPSCDHLKPYWRSCIDRYNQILVSAIRPNACKTITEALERASDGIKILVEPGVYAENLKICKNVILQGLIDGAGNKPVVTSATESSACVLDVQAAATISCLLVRPSEKIPGDEAKYEPCPADKDVCDWYPATIVVAAAAKFDKVDVCNSIGAGIKIAGDYNPSFENCSAYSNKRGGVLLGKGAKGKFVNCDFYGNGFEVMGGTPVFGREGAAVEAFGTGTVTEFVNCKISKNRLQGVASSSGAKPVFNSCEISDNSLQGVESFGDGSEPVLNQCKVYGNKESVSENELNEKIRIENAAAVRRENVANLRDSIELKERERRERDNRLAAERAQREADHREVSRLHRAAFDSQKRDVQTRIAQGRYEVEERNRMVKENVEASIIDREARMERQRVEREMAASKKIVAFDIFLFILSVILLACWVKVGCIAVAVLTVIAAASTFFIAKSYLKKNGGVKIALIVMLVLAIVEIVVCAAVKTQEPAMQPESTEAISDVPAQLETPNADSTVVDSVKN